MRLWFANKIISLLAVRRDGVSLPPTADLGSRSTEVDGQEVVLLSQGDSFDLICGKDSYYVHHLSPRTALKLAWFVLWRWWLRGTWCGWKLSAWEWATSVQLDEQRLRRAGEDLQRRMRRLNANAHKPPQTRAPR